MPWIHLDVQAGSLVHVHAHQLEGGDAIEPPADPLCAEHGFRDIRREVHVATRMPQPPLAHRVPDLGARRPRSPELLEGDGAVQWNPERVDVSHTAIVPAGARPRGRSHVIGAQLLGCVICAGGPGQRPGANTAQENRPLSGLIRKLDPFSPALGTGAGRESDRWAAGRGRPDRWGAVGGGRATSESRRARPAAGA